MMTGRRIGGLKPLVFLFSVAGCQQPLLREDSEVTSASTSVAGTVPTSEIYDDLVRRHLDNGNYHEAMRTLPKTMAEWDKAQEEAGHSFEGAAGYIYFRVMSTVANAGDSAWGTILDDPEIPYGYKTNLIFEILEARLGEGAVYRKNDDVVVPMNGPISLEVLRRLEPTD